MTNILEAIVNIVNNPIVAIIPTNKYNSLPIKSIKKIENLRSSKLTIKKVQVKDPNNPANRIDAKLIIFKQ